mmetsp:Transcript_13775/g.17086  ORF Transcript_13775/g.17086 Transcript_13775/m.17086 type:complete len:81 (+) Transcript_13775:309-551(+)
MVLQQCPLDLDFCSRNYASDHFAPFARHSVPTNSRLKGRRSETRRRLRKIYRKSTQRMHAMRRFLRYLVSTLSESSARTG